MERPACLSGAAAARAGYVIGIDTHAALNIAAARSCDRVVLSELLPAAEAGLVEALYSAVRSRSQIGTRQPIDF